jgi:hypothetical protein
MGIDKNEPLALGGARKVSRLEVERLLEKGIDKLTKNEIEICLFEAKQSLWDTLPGSRSYKKIVYLIETLMALRDAKDSFEKMVVESLFLPIDE